MNNIVISKDASYEKYKKLLIKKDNISKEARQYQINYVREFGDLIAKAFETKIKCIEKKKIIAYCQKIINSGGSINQSDIDNYINEIMKEYYEELKEMLDEKARMNKLRTLPELTVRKIKKIYLEIAKKIHPDMNPKIKDDQKVQELWNRTVIAYECNDLKEIEELRDLVKTYLDSIGYEGNDVEIENLEAKIKKLEEEIDRVYNTDPYQYKFLLSDYGLIAEKNNELNEEIEEYENYLIELEEIIKSFEVHKVYA